MCLDKTPWVICCKPTQSMTKQLAAGLVKPVATEMMHKCRAFRNGLGSKSGMCSSGTPKTLQILEDLEAHQSCLIDTQVLRSHLNGREPGQRGSTVTACQGKENLPANRGF